MSDNSKYLFCSCVNSEIIPEDRKKRVLAALIASHRDVLSVSDLCRLSAHRAPMLRKLAESGDLTIIACHPRAVRYLFRRAEVELQESRVKFIDMRANDLHEVLDELSCEQTDVEVTADLFESDEHDSWPPWFPVIDYDRCINCKQCMNFCLFGVYETDSNDYIKVTNPELCKNNCPACARICPEAAIIFPKCSESPINGEEIDDELAVRANIKVNMDEILGSDVYTALAQRKKKRDRILLNREKMDRALAERKKFTGPKE